MAPGISQKLFTINSNWTAEPPRAGWRHYRISGRRYEAEALFLEMMAVCDRKVRLWVPAEELKDAAQWKPGWLD